MSENSNPVIRALRRTARFIGLETAGRSLYHRLTRSRETAPDIKGLQQQANRAGADVQFVMDINPSSPWFHPEFQARWGGFHPPGTTRQLTRCFEGDRVRSDMITLLLREITVRKIPGAIAELGVHRGESARLLHQYCPERQIFLFDTFEGFAKQDMAQETVKLDYTQAQQFTDTDVATVLHVVEPRNANVVPVVGWFPASITPAVESATFAFVHLDADLEAPIAAGLEFFWPRMSAGGFLVVHDYNAWPGARLAVDRFLEKQRAVSVPMPDKSGSVVLAKI